MREARLFVAFRWCGRRVSSTEASVPRACRSLLTQIEATGGRLVGWMFPLIACAFELDAWQEAIALATSDAVDRRFAVGMAEGLAWSLEARKGATLLSHGPGLSAARTLARLARQGEVLLHPRSEPVQTHAILHVGSRFVVSGGERLRAPLLDRSRPWRTAPEDDLSHLPRAAWIGPHGFGELAARRGALGVVRAARGAGGSRWLLEFAAAQPSARVLPVQPGPLGEPLGALRFAFAKALANEVVPPELTGEHGALLETLLAGEALEQEAIVTLLGAWLFAEGSTPILAVDEVERLDADSLESLAAACSALNAVLVVRATDNLALPSALATLPRSFEVQLGQLSPTTATDFVRALLGPAIDENFARRLARRGGYSAGAIEQATHAAIETSELIWDQHFIARGRKLGRGPSQPAEAWIRRRWSRLDSNAQRLLLAIALLGGEAECAELQEFLDIERSELEAWTAPLIRGRWLVKSAVRMLALTRASLAQVILASIAADELASFHVRFAAQLERAGTPMGSVRAVMHLLVAGHEEAARTLARRGAAACRAAGLARTADALDGYTKQGSTLALAARGLIAGWSGLVDRDDDQDTIPPAPAAERGEQELDDLISQFELERDQVDTGRILSAWREGDLAEIERYAGELRGSAGAALSDWLLAMAQLARGRTGDGLRLLRENKNRAAHADSAQRSRAALALGVGLAAAGRPTEALLEALEGLARAREAADGLGERACARFLAGLARDVGEDYAVTRWDLLGAG